MRFSLQNLVRQTLAEADRREHIKLAAGPCPECGKSECDCPAAKKARMSEADSASNTPERNEEGSDAEGEKTSSMFVEKLASAVDYCNENFLKAAAETNVGPGDGTGALPLNSPTSGEQSEETGQAKNNQPPMNPGSDVKSPGQTNPETALETDINAPPGGPGEQPQMKQAGARLDAVKRVASRGKEMLTGGKLKQLRTNMALGGTAGLKKEIGKETAKVWGSRAAAGLGVAGAAKGVHSLATSGKKKKASADLSRVLGIMDKMAENSANSSVSAGTSNPHQSSPPLASASGEGPRPNSPGEVSKQEAMVGSNAAAIAYNKGQAKAVPKARMGEVLSEPAQKKSTDPVLHQNLDAASSAGVKLSSISKRAAAESLLRKIAQEGEGEEATPEQKEKAQKLQELLKSKQQEKASQGMSDGSGQMGGGGGNALGGGY